MHWIVFKGKSCSCRVLVEKNNLIFFKKVMKLNSKSAIKCASMLRLKYTL